MKVFTASSRQGLKSQLNLSYRVRICGYKHRMGRSSVGLRPGIAQPLDQYTYTGVIPSQGRWPGSLTTSTPTTVHSLCRDPINKAMNILHGAGSAVARDGR